MEHVEVCAFVIHLLVNLLQIFCRPIHLSWPVDIAVHLHVLQLSFSFLQRPLPWVLYMRVVLTCLWKNFMNIVFICSCSNAMYCDILCEKCSEFLQWKPGVCLHYDSIICECGVITLFPPLYMKGGLLYDGVPCRSASRLRMLHAMRGCCLHRCSPAASW